MHRLAAMETFFVVEAGSFCAAAKRLDVGQPAKLRVCAAVTVARLHVLPHLKRFLHAHPGLRIDVVLDDRNVDLLEKGIAVELRMGDLQDSGMTARKITQGGRSDVGTPASFAAAGTHRVPADLAQHEAVICAQGGGGHTWSFESRSSQISVAVKARVHVTAAEGVRAAVLGDMGIAIGSDWMFAPEIASGEVLRVMTDWALPAIDLWAVFPTGRMASTKARAIVDFVQGILVDPVAAQTTADAAVGSSV